MLEKTFLILMISFSLAAGVLTGQTQTVQLFTGSYTFGVSCSDKGDFNGDGYADLIVGDNSYNNFKGKVYLYYGGNPMDNHADLIFKGENKGDNFGKSISFAGDLNGDGYDDIIIGAGNYNGCTGRAYIFYGGSSPDNKPDVILTGETVNSYFGFSVSGAGDVNGDCYDDVIVGAYQVNKAYIFYGGSQMNNSFDILLSGSLTFGYSVAGAGDVNGDSFDDVIVGEYFFDGYSGKANIFYGGSPMNTTVDVTMAGPSGGSKLGSSVAGGGDINGDGFDDVIVGAPGYNNLRGLTRIYFGGPAMDGDFDVSIEGKSLCDYEGISVAGIGDINRDGYDDIITGADGYDGNNGRVRVFYGGRSMDNVADITFGYGHRTGIAVTGGGDTNGDGYPDFAVSGNYQVTVLSDPIAPMTVELPALSVTVNNSKVFLHWKTVTGVSNYRFQIQRQKGEDKDEWENIGFVESARNGNSSKEYSFTDENPLAGKVQYRLKQIDANGEYEFSENVEVTINNTSGFKLFQNYPNPFNPTTFIKYCVPFSSRKESLEVSLVVYDLLGTKVKTLVNTKQTPGVHVVSFDASGLPSGIYYYELKVGDDRDIKEMALLK